MPVLQLLVALGKVLFGVFVLRVGEVTIPLSP